MNVAPFDTATRLYNAARTPQHLPRPSPDTSALLTQWLLQSLDAVDYGMLLIDAQGDVRHSNQAAREALDHRHPLQLAGSRLVARGDDDEAALQDALTAAARRGLRRLLSVGQGAGRVCVAVVPLELMPGLPSGASLLLLGRREACQRLSIEWFARAYGLTPAETRVLEALAQGDEPREIAEAFDVGLATVRTQIGCIRAKVGADSIRDLLRMVGMLPPMLSALRAS